MALKKQVLQFPFAGLDQGVDPKVAQGLLLLENTRQERKSEFVKRNGLTPLTGSYSDGNLAVYRGRPILFGNSGVYSEAAGDGSMVKADDAGFFDVELIDIGVGGNCVVQVCQVFEGGTDLLVVSYIKRDQVSGAQTEHLEVYDRTTGRLIDSSTTQGPAVIVADGDGQIYYVCRSLNYTGPTPAAGYYMQVGLITSGGTINTGTDIVDWDEPTQGTGPYDVCAVASGEIAILHTRATSADAQLIIASDLTATQSFARCAVTSGESVHAVSCWLQAANYIACAVATTVSEHVDVSTYDDSPAVDDSPVTMWDWSSATGTGLADDKCTELTGWPSSSTAGRVYMTLGAHGSDDDKNCRAIYNTYSGAGTSLSVGTATDPFEEGCRLASQPFEDADGTHYVVIQREGEYLKGLGKLCMVVSENDQIFARFLMDKAMADFTSDPGWLFPVTDRADAWTLGAVKRTGFETSSVVAVRLEKLSSGVRAVEAHGLLVLPGAHPWVFDGTDVTELGFLHYPSELTITPKGTWDLLNDIATQYTAHLSFSGHNIQPDTSNTLSSGPATDDASAQALANELKVDIVQHGANNGNTWHSTPDAITISSPGATDYASLVTLVTELRTEYEAHRIRVAGVHSSPDSTNDVTEDYDTSLEEGYHGYQSIYERYLKTGHRDQSAPSPLQSFDPDGDLSGNAEGEQLQITCEELHHTKQSATLVLYRTNADLATPYRLTMQTNNVDAYEATFNDGASDTDLDGQPYPYITGRRLENLPPPPSRVMWVHQERLFAVNREEESWDVRYSMQFEQGKGIAFNDVLQVVCSPAGGRIVSGASLLGRGVLFKASSIYAFYGKGLGLTGTGAGYSTPELISPAIGCTNHKTVVETPLGLMFLSEDGIYLLDKQFKVGAIGKPVKYHTDNVTLTGVAHVKDRHLVIWSSDGVALVYDYLYNTWGSYTGYAGDDICVADDGTVFLKDTSSTLYYENRALWQDGGEVKTAVGMLARSGWVATAAYQKLHAIGILGQARSDCTVRVKIAYDFKLDSNGYPEWEHNVTLDVNALGYHETDDHYGATGSSGTSHDALLANIQVSRRCRSFCIEITDETRSGQSTVGKGISLTSLELLVSGKQGQFVPGTARQMT